MLRCIDVINLISKNSLFTEHKESMGKATRNKELALIILAQFHHYIFTESLAAPAQINGNIQNLAFDNTYQLSL